MRGPRFLFALLLSSLAVITGSPVRSQMAPESMMPESIEFDDTLGADVSSFTHDGTDPNSGVNTYTIEGGVRVDQEQICSTASNHLMLRHSKPSTLLIRQV